MPMAYDNLRCLLPIKQNQPEISPASAESSFNGKAMAPCLISLASLDQRASAPIPVGCWQWNDCKTTIKLPSRITSILCLMIIMIRYSEWRSLCLCSLDLGSVRINPTGHPQGPLPTRWNMTCESHTEKAQKNCLMFGGSSTSFLAETSTMALASKMKQHMFQNMTWLKYFRFRYDIVYKICLFILAWF